MLFPPAFTAALVAIGLGAAQAVMAQAPAANKNAAALAATSSGDRANQRIERIRIEDAGSRIDELRVGGETQSITVSPKGGMPAYEVIPPSANRGAATFDRNGSATTGGTRVWNILEF